jgi:hypothetical protein
MKTLLSVISICCMTTALRASCPMRTLDQQWAVSDVVFTGRAIDQKVVSEDGRGAHTLTTFAVEEMWKGTVEKTITIQTCGGIGNGGVPPCPESSQFRVGMQYLIFAIGQPIGHTSTCLPTGLLERAQPTLQWLADKPRVTGR